MKMYSFLTAIITGVVFVGTFFYADQLVKWLRIPLQNMFMPGSLSWVPTALSSKRRRRAEFSADSISALQPPGESLPPFPLSSEFSMRVFRLLSA